MALTMVPCPSCRGGCGSFMLEGMSMVDSRMSEEDARRIVASVNPLQKFSIEELESPEFLLLMKAFTVGDLRS